ncbi:MAG: helix-turn-helix transcriptional regulator [Verrucomicrobiota bacterium]
MINSVPLELLSVAHYHQDPRSQPGAQRLEIGSEAVELVTRGRGWIEHEGEWLEVRPGALLWHREGDRTIAKSDPEDPYSCLSVRMRGDRFEGRRLPRVSIWPDREAVEELTEESIQMFLDEGFDKGVLLQYLFSKLLYQAKLYHHRKESGVMPEALLAAGKLIDERYGEAIKMEDLVRVSGWSAPHLHEQFKRHYGTSPHQRIMARRIRAGRELLLGSGLSIKEIAAETGFTHSSAFCAAFKKSVGVSPKKFRDGYFFG